jgi:protease-4
MEGEENPLPPVIAQEPDCVGGPEPIPDGQHEEGIPEKDAANPPSAATKAIGAHVIPAVPASQPITPGFKWFLIITLGLLLVCGATAAYYFLTSTGTEGVTVVRMEGTLVTGEAYDSEFIGSEVVGSELRKAADDPLVEAIVLRVNSPGGTPAAAQEIIGDLEYAKTKKPVVVSMGDMGTSAAYYVSAHADRIYANPDTFTAGIGVIWKFSDISRWMEKEGYNVSVVKSGSKKDMGSTNRPLTTDEEEYAQKVVSESFETFVADITSERVIARSDIEDGRVIRGADAVKINVIDELGNLNDAIDGAKRLAESRAKPSLPGLPS